MPRGIYDRSLAKPRKTVRHPPITVTPKIAAPKPKVLLELSLESFDLIALEKLKRALDQFGTVTRFQVQNAPSTISFV